MNVKRFELYSPKKTAKSKDFIGYYKSKFSAVVQPKPVLLIKENFKYRKVDLKKDFKILCETNVPHSNYDAVSFHKTAVLGIYEIYGHPPKTDSSIVPEASIFTDANLKGYSLDFDLSKTVRDNNGKCIPGGCIVRVAVPLSKENFDDLIKLIPAKSRENFDDELTSKPDPTVFLFDKFVDENKNTEIKVEIKKEKDKGKIIIEIISHKLNEKFMFETEIGKKDMQKLTEILNDDLPKNIKKELEIK